MSNSLQSPPEGPFDSQASQPLIEKEAAQTHSIERDGTFLSINNRSEAATTFQADRFKGSVSPAGKQSSLAQSQYRKGNFKMGTQHNVT